MIDLFHLQLIKGNITNTLNDLRSYIGHIQVSVISSYQHQNAIDSMTKKKEKRRNKTDSRMNWEKTINF